MHVQFLMEMRSLTLDFFELAFVLGHELSLPCRGRNVTEILSLILPLMLIASVTAFDLTNSTDYDWAVRIAFALPQIRFHEYEADRIECLWDYVKKVASIQ